MGRQSLSELEIDKFGKNIVLNKEAILKCVPKILNAEYNIKLLSRGFLVYTAGPNAYFCAPSIIPQLLLACSGKAKSELMSIILGNPDE